MPDFKHIILDGRTTALPYSTRGGGNFDKRGIGDRNAHGNRIKQAFQDAVNEFSEGDEDYDFVYLEFESAINFELEVDKFEDKKGDIRLASCKRVVTGFNNKEEEEVIYKAAVYLNKKAVGIFLEKLDKYLNENTVKGNPKYQGLVANLEQIRAATLESFWQEPEIPFPPDDQNVWWEIWLDREGDSVSPEQNFFDQLGQAEVQIGARILVFPEHFVTLVKATAPQLGKSLIYTDKLAEIRKPVEAADFFTYLDKDDQDQFIDDLNNRIGRVEKSTISVCLLDTGINRTNPLLENLVPAENLETVEPAWTTADTHPHGHGTPMAGLIFFGDLTEALSSNGNISILHHLESIKIIEANNPNDPDLYGNITIEAISRGETLNPDNKRIVCLAVSAPDNHHLGKPSSWSSAVDQVSFGNIEDRNDRNLILVSAGNLSLEERLTSPLSNNDASVQDPGQAFNALTVGSYTLKDQIDLATYPGAELLANRGAMAPCNTTSVLWNKEWPRKPDIVMEGGNDGTWNNGLCDPDSLKLLSTNKGGLGRSWFTTFGDTSASTALASKICAELYFDYPELWPETIRGLIVHSADWTSTMLSNRNIDQLSSDEQKNLISKVGYGVPNLNKARSSANNSLTLIAQRILKPYKYEERVKTNEFHLFDLPWPSEVLLELAEEQVTLKVTLSYFVEPNPGNKRYANASSYRSHGLRFKMIDRNETEHRFKARVSNAIKVEQGDYVAEGKENWVLGSSIRDKGSIHKDFWKGNAADLALRNKIAVYPVGGWWKDRKKLGRYDFKVRYSLVVSIETANQDTDIYNPVLNQISVDIEI